MEVEEHIELYPKLNKMKISLNTLKDQLQKIKEYYTTRIVRNQNQQSEVSMIYEHFKTTFRHLHRITQILEQEIFNLIPPMNRRNALLTLVQDVFNHFTITIIEIFQLASTIFPDDFIDDMEEIKFAYFMVGPYLDPTFRAPPQMETLYNSLTKNKEEINSTEKWIHSFSDQEQAGLFETNLRKLDKFASDLDQALNEERPKIKDFRIPIFAYYLLKQIIYLSDRINKNCEKLAPEFAARSRQIYSLLSRYRLGPLLNKLKYSPSTIDFHKLVSEQIQSISSRWNSELEANEHPSTF